MTDMTLATKQRRVIFVGNINNLEENMGENNNTSEKQFLFVIMTTCFNDNLYVMLNLVAFV